jgi:hypothetical protein
MFYLSPFMKHFLICALVALVAAGTSACSTEAPAPSDFTGDPSSRNDIVGEWNWKSTDGGFSGKQHYTPASTGTATKWVFQRNGTFQQYDTTQGVTRLVETTTFSLGAKRSIYTGQPAQTLIINRHVTQSGTATGQVEPQEFIIQELDQQLIIADNYYDGFGHTYERK